MNVVCMARIARDFPTPSWWQSIQEGDLLILLRDGKAAESKIITKNMVNLVNKEIRMAKKSKANVVSAAKFGRSATYTIEWWRSKKDRDFYARAICFQNGEETWRQSEGLNNKADMLRVIDGLFQGKWGVRKIEDPSN